LPAAGLPFWRKKEAKTLTQRTRSLGYKTFAHSKTSVAGLLTQTTFRQFGIFVYPFGSGYSIDYKK
jgi:hypothetical protein